MTSHARCFRAGALAASLLCWSVAPAAAAPIRVQAVPPVSMGTFVHARGTRASGLRYMAVPALGAFTVRRLAGAAPIHALPLTIKRQPVSAMPVLLLPRVGWATALVPLVAGACLPRRRPDPIETLPSPVAQISSACVGRAAASDDLSRSTTSLAPGRNKNALYGPAYTPSSDDLH